MNERRSGRFIRTGKAEYALKLKRFSMAAGTITAALTMSISDAGSAAAFVNSAPVYFVDSGSDSNRCLGTWQGAVNTTAIIWDCNDNPDQRWSFEFQGVDRQGNPFYRIQADNQACLTLDGNVAPGSWLMAETCDDSKSGQLWYALYKPTLGSWIIANKNTLWCMGSENGNTANGTHAIVWPCNYNQDQLWGSSVNP